LARLPDCRSVIEEGNRHPWRGCQATVYSLTLRDDVQHHFGRLAERLEEIAASSALLHRLGFGPDKPKRGEWLGALEAARLVLSCAQVPAAWFEVDPRPVAEAVVRLNRLTRKYREMRDAVPEFEAEALRRKDPTSLLNLAAGTEGSGPRLLPELDETVR